MKDPGASCPIAVALVHHPVYNRKGEILTTSVTSVDIHDIARAARTYGASPYYLVTPILAQRDMVDKVAAHWSDSDGSKADHPRGEALGQLLTMPDIEAAALHFQGLIGAKPLIVVTGANLENDITSFPELRAQIESGSLPGLLIIFGTGWGLTRELTDGADVRLEPIAGPTEYRHLSVRAAVAITLDRLRGISIY